MTKKTVIYSKITEGAGLPASVGQLEKLYQRYRFGRQWAEGRDVLEVACGQGLGLGYLAEKARRVIGVDIDCDNAAAACRSTANGGPIHVCRADAQSLPFQSRTFDLVLMFEAYYYLKDPDAFLGEAARVLRPGGHIIIGAVNPAVQGFHRSPYSERYFTAPELQDKLAARFEGPSSYAAFEAVADRIFLAVKKTALALRLMPATLAGRARLKRLLGPLQPIPTSVHDGMCAYERPRRVEAERIGDRYQVFYLLARAKGDGR